MITRKDKMLKLLEKHRAGMDTRKVYIELSKRMDADEIKWFLISIFTLMGGGVIGWSIAMAVKITQQ